MDRDWAIFRLDKKTRDADRVRVHIGVKWRDMRIEEAGSHLTFAP